MDNCKVNDKLITAISTHSTAYAEILNLIDVYHHLELSEFEEIDTRKYLLKSTIHRLLHGVYETEKFDVALKLTELR